MRSCASLARCARKSTSGILFGQAGFNYWVPPDGQHGVIEENDRRSCGDLQEDPARVRAGPGQPVVPSYPANTGPLGNYLAFAYVENRLDRIRVNRANRVVTFTYDAFSRIGTIHDHTGRTWRYSYDDHGDLVRVRSPGTARYAADLASAHEYSSSTYAAPPQHNLVRVFDSDGRLYLENEYGSARSTAVILVWQAWHLLRILPRRWFASKKCGLFYRARVRLLAKALEDRSPSDHSSYAVKKIP